MLSCLGKSTTLKSECPFIVHPFPGAPFGLSGGNALISGGLRSHIGGFGCPVARQFFSTTYSIQDITLLPIDRASSFSFLAH